MGSNDVVRLCLKVWNWGMGVGGIATVMYGILVFRVWPVGLGGGGSSSSSRHISIPWFFHGILFVGLALCAVTLLGHLAATTANNCCLSTYIVTILLLLIFETLIIAHAFFHPKDSQVIVSDSFDDFTDSLLKYLASLIFLIQAICVLLAALSLSINHEIDGHGDGSETEEYEDDDPRLALLDRDSDVSPWQRDERRIATLI